ncbi:hypothetical protein CHK_0921 [Christensenella hongkongensis]|uniref:Uncharacterized protein n=1 Tax=Christensenella hongkongensis TaxID=270498 RepID=A0A0M2NGT5_9FIRM|nr:hypothetical protein CHK_0921 [Christensenella hongkongensis]
MQFAKRHKRQFAGNYDKATIIIRNTHNVRCGSMIAEALFFH